MGHPVYIYIYIYIHREYIHREREREKERERERGGERERNAEYKRIYSIILIRNYNLHFSLKLTQVIFREIVSTPKRKDEVYCSLGKRG